MSDTENKAVTPDGTDTNTHDAGGTVPGAVQIDADGTTTGAPAGTPTDTATNKGTPVVGHPTAATPTTAETDNTVTSVNVHKDAANTADPVTGAATGMQVDPMDPANTGVSDPNHSRTGS